jgi:hypothetical protein
MPANLKTIAESNVFTLVGSADQVTNMNEIDDDQSDIKNVFNSSDESDEDEKDEEALDQMIKDVMQEEVKPQAELAGLALGPALVWRETEKEVSEENEPQVVPALSEEEVMVENAGKTNNQKDESKNNNDNDNDNDNAKHVTGTLGNKVQVSDSSGKHANTSSTIGDVSIENADDERQSFAIPTNNQTNLTNDIYEYNDIYN